MIRRQVATRFQEAFAGLLGQYLSPEALAFLPTHLRYLYLSSNRALTSDAYNRTMHQLSGNISLTPTVYVQSMRRSPFGKMVAAGQTTLLDRIFGRPISEGEVQVARDLAERQHQHFPEDMWQAVLDNEGYLPVDIYAVPEGEVLLPHEPMFVVKGPNEIAAHLEPLLIPIFYPSAVATHAFLHTDQGQTSFALQDPRNVPDPYVGMLVNDAAATGGIHSTSSDAAAAGVTDMFSWGTVAHRFLSLILASGQSEYDAFKIIDQKLDRPCYLVDLLDTFGSGVPAAIRVIKESSKPQSLHAIRPDSGDMSTLVPDILRMLAAENLNEVSIVVSTLSDGDSLAERKKISDAVRAAGFDPQKRLKFGAGGAMVWEKKSRSDWSAAYKISMAFDKGVLKLAEEIGKMSLPGIPMIFRNYQHATVQSIVGQASETDQMAALGYQPIMVPVVLNGRVVSENLKAMGIDQTRVHWNVITQKKHLRSNETQAVAREFVAHAAPQRLGVLEAAGV